MVDPETVEAGDVVILNSGGPAMTVFSVEDDIINCMWFDNRGKIYDDSFPCETLTYSYQKKEEKEEKEEE